MNDTQITDIIRKMTLHEKIMLSMGKNSWITQEYPQYGIPYIRVSDGTNGIRFQKDSDKDPVPYFEDSLNGSFDSPEAMERTIATTCYPSGSAMACTWNRELMEKMGRQLANECRSMGINVLLGPGMNIRRHALGARNFEYYSEDPCLSGEMAASLVQGVQSNHVGTSIKHFACHNSDDRRTRVNVKVDERALREIYLEGYERVVKKAHPATIMTCYNQINGVEVSEDASILRDIVRGEWGFDGVFISDWGSVKDVSESTKGGLDLQMPCSMISAEKLEKDIQDGIIDESLLDERLFHILKLVFKYAGTEKIQNDPEGNHRLAVEAAAESAVLLKNEEKMLPLDAGKKQTIAIIGLLSKQPNYVGSGCAIVRTEHAEVPFDEIQKLCTGETTILYASAYKEDGSTDERLLAEAEAVAKEADQVLVFAGSFLPHESDMYNRTSMDLPEGHTKAILTAARTNKNCAVILSGGDVSIMPWRDEVRSILCTWYGGEGMGSAVADLLFGKRTPCGKLPVTIPVCEEDTPAYLTVHQTPYEMVYGESIYVGYRSYDKRKITPAFPFGHGLSYTEFCYENAKIVSQDDEQVILSVDISNTGLREGKEIVQCYVSAVSPITARPVRELKEFANISLRPGESKTVEFRLSQRDFSFYDVRNHEWVTDVPDYLVEFAASSRDIRQTVAVKRPVTIRPFRKLGKNCGFHELFENKKGMEMFLEFACKHGLLPAAAANEDTARKLEGTFWSVRSYLDMNAHGVVTTEMIDELIENINRELQSSLT